MEHQHCFAAAQKGEELCRQGDNIQGLKYLEQALKYGTSDVYLLSALYSQLGNAHFALKQFDRASEFHSQDLMLCRAIHDTSGEACAFSNLALARSAQKLFDKAIPCIDSLMAISLKLNDRSLLSRAYYTKGYVYLQKAREMVPREREEISLFPHAIRSTCISDITREDLYTAIDAFVTQSKIAEDINDQTALALAYGNLGLCHFTLEEYDASCQYHEKKLDIVRALNDKPAMRKTFTNIGTSHFFNSDFESAIKYYECSAQISEELGDKSLQAQAYYSIGLSAMIEGHYDQAISSHSKHLQLCRELKDLIGQSRSLSALASIFLLLKQIPKAVYFYIVKYRIALELNDYDMECKVRNSIRIAIQSDPMSILKEGRVVLDSTSDLECPLLLDDDDLLLEDEQPLDPSSISFAFREDGKATSVPNLTEAMTKFVVDCANGQRGGKVLPMKNLGDSLQQKNMSLARSLPNVKNVVEGEEVDVLDMIINSQRRREYQRCDASILKDTSNNSLRQTDTLCTAKLYDTENPQQSRRRTIMTSLSNFKRGKFSSSKKSNKKSGKPPIPFSSTPLQHGKATTLNVSPLSSINAYNFTHVPFDNDVSVTSTPAASTRNNSIISFVVPDLPNRRRNVSECIINKENHEVFQRTSSARFLNDSKAPRASTEDFENLCFVDDNRSINSFPSFTGKYNPEAILDLIASIQSRRMDEQRADLILPGLKDREEFLAKYQKEFKDKMVSSEEQLMDEKLYDLIMEFQGDRIEEQRSALGGKDGTNSIEDDIKNIVLKMQAGRIEAQRADLKSSSTKSSTSDLQISPTTTASQN
jgi:tetratricopeptide (TPR) repeat protein